MYWTATNMEWVSLCPFQFFSFPWKLFMLAKDEANFHESSSFSRMNKGEWWHKWMNGSFVSTPQHNSDMVNFILTPAAIKAANNKYDSSTMMQTKIPQTAADEHCKETFNDRTRRSLLKINLFIKRLKWFNIFTDAPSTKPTQTTEINPKWWDPLNILLTAVPNEFLCISLATNSWIRKKICRRRKCIGRRRNYLESTVL